LVNKAEVVVEPAEKTVFVEDLSKEDKAKAGLKTFNRFAADRH
jgi:hypothetical protein